MIGVIGAILLFSGELSKVAFGATLIIIEVLVTLNRYRANMSKDVGPQAPAA